MARFNPILKHVLVAVALLCLSLVAVQPFVRSQMLLTDDGTLHLYRTIVLDHSLRYDGSLYPRFSSALVYGYGAPLFNYFSPAAYYLPRSLHVLGLPFVSAWLAAMVMYLWVAMLGAYLLGQKLSNQAGGIITAISYLYAPYMLYDAVSRGTITEIAALAALPYVLYTLTRLSRHPSPHNFMFVVISYSLFIPLHNIVTLHGSMLIAGYSLSLVYHSSDRRAAFLRLGAAGLLSLGITSFFWLPALGETSLIKLPAITATLPDLDVTRHLRPLSEVLALPQPVDARQQQALIPITVSWISLLLGSIGFIISIGTRRQRGLVIFWWVVALVGLFMNTEASAIVWRTVPLLDYTQFAWRVLGIVSLALAILSGLSLWLIFTVFAHKKAQMFFFAGVIISSILYAVPFTYRPSVMLQANSVQDAQYHERTRGEVALSSYSEYLPVWAASTLDAQGLLSEWQSSQVVSRWPPDADVELLSASWQGTSARLNVYATESQPLSLAWLYMPNWQVTANGIALATRADRQGLLTFDVPSGESDIVVFYGLSELQQFAWFASGVSATLSVMLVGWWWRRIQMVHVHHAAQTDHSFLLIAVVAGLLMVVIKALVIDSTDNFLHQQRWREDQFNGQPVAPVSFANRLNLLFTDETIVRIDEAVSVVVSTYWTVPQVLDENYGVVYSVRNAEGIEVARASKYQLAQLDTQRWLPDLYLQDVTTIQLPEGTLPGSYNIYVSIYGQDGVLPTINAVGSPDIPEWNVGIVDIPRVVYQSTTNTVSKLALQDSTGLPEQSQDGTPFILSMNWLAGTQNPRNSSIQLVWESGDEVVTRSERIPFAPLYPPEEWNEKEVWTTYIRSTVPLFNTSGEYRVSLHVHDADDVTSVFTIGDVSVESPERTFERPQAITTSEAVWQNGIELVGYHLEGAAVSLVWQTSEYIKEDLRLFVHVLNTEDVIIAQRDEIPRNWTRPTTGWLPGEYITTTYELNEVTSANVALSIGFYNPYTYQRLPLTVGTDHYRIHMVATGN